MTTFESFYLLLCVGAFVVFAVTLAYNDLKWQSLKKASKPAVAPSHASNVSMAH